jgi:heme iron utilization protein
MSDDASDDVSDDPHSRGGPPTYVQHGAATPTQAERARTLVAGEVDGTLSTIALEPAGFPFGSIVTYALDDVGAPLVLMSTLAEHTRNLAADPRSSLLVTAGGDGAGRLAAARATLVGTFTRVDDDAQDDATARYLEVHPRAFWARFPDFAMYRAEVRAIRYVRGFGEMSWVEPAGFASAEPDPIASGEAGIVEHMNDDHAASLLTMVDAFLPVEGEVTAATMTSCDRYGFEVQLALAPAEAGGDPGLAFGRIGFEAPLSAIEDARHAMVALVRAAEVGSARQDR